MKPAIAIAPAAFVVALAGGCAAAHQPASTPESARSPRAASGPPATIIEVKRVPAPGLRGLACDPSGCRALLEAGIAQVDPTDLTIGEILPLPTPPPQTIQADAQGWQGLWSCEAPAGCMGPLDGSSPPLPLPLATPDTGPDPSVALADWNEMRAQGWRVPFAQRLPTDDGGLITYLRGMGDGAGRLIRTGPGRRVADVPGLTAAASYPRWLALHPSGREAYLLTWPGAELLAFDPHALTIAWRLALEPAASGLFLDPQGRWLLAQVSEQPDPDRGLDFAPESTPIAAALDPAGDIALSRIDRPRGGAVAVIDLATRQVALTVEGDLRAFEPLTDGAWLLATEGWITRLEPRLPAR